MKTVAFLAAFLALPACGGAALQTPYLPSVDTEFTISRLATMGSSTGKSDLQITNNTIELKRAQAFSLSNTYVQAMRNQAMERAGRVAGAANGSVNLVMGDYGQVFIAPVTIGAQSFEMVVDTGSSDPWLVTPNFQCVSLRDGGNIAESNCDFGSTLYDPSGSATYRALADQNFNISYADGEALDGTLGLETFVMGGITVTNQEFGVVDRAAWSGDGTSSGLVGFAYSTLTSAYSGTDPGADVSGETLIYNTLFTNMWQNEGVPPVFSMALTRPNSSREVQPGGVMALGGLPDVPHSPSFASTPIVPYGINVTDGAKVYEFYAIAIDGYAISAQQDAQFDVYSTGNPYKTPLVGPAEVIIDSGTTLVYADDDVAQAIAEAFTPAGSYDESEEVWTVPCDATPPLWGVSIDRKIFHVNAADMILQYTETQCVSGVQRNFGGLTILGDVWMKNVISVFDIGASMMRFAAREYYDLDSYDGE